MSSGKFCFCPVTCTLQPRGHAETTSWNWQRNDLGTKYKWHLKELPYLVALCTVCRAGASHKCFPTTGISSSLRLH